jgi:mRNA interferase MazF
VICDFGDVVVVPFPFVDVAAEKRRPSVIISRKSFNDSHRHSICAMITTAAHSKWPSDITIEELEPAGLDRPCIVRWKLFTLPNDLILRRVGKLAIRDRNNVASAVREFLP